MMTESENVALYCKSCRAQLTTWLKPIRTAREANRICDFNPIGGDVPVPRGFALMVGGELLRARQGAARSWNPEGKEVAWVNLADVAPNVGLTTNPTRLNGCCGLDGMDGPNRLCICGAEVGTESSDCWTWHMFTTLPNATEWIVK